MKQLSLIAIFLLNLLMYTGKSAWADYATSGEPMLANLQARLDWSYESAWKEKNGQREIVSLCGLWNFAAALEASSVIPDASSADWAYFIVPGHWRGGNITNYVHTKDGRAVTGYNETPLKDVYHGWYKRTLDIPAEWKGRQVIWNFERLDMSGEIFLNGKTIGDTSKFTHIHSGQFDISDLLRYGDVNEFAVRCDTDKENIGGLRGIVNLQVSPRNHFGTPHITSTDYRNKTMTLSFRDPAVQKGELSITVRDWKTNEAVFSQEYPFSSELTMDYMPPKLWSPEAPNLYFMDIVLKNNGEIVDSKTIRFGFSDFWVDGADYYLNGKKIILSADTALDDGGYWTVDWKMGKDYVRRQLKLMRAMNINATYFGALMPKQLLDLYDEEGIIVIAASTIPYKQHMALTDEEAYAEFLRKIDDIKNSDFFDNHPSHLCYQIDVWFNYNDGAVNHEFVGLKNSSDSHKALDKNGDVIELFTKDPTLSSERIRRKNRLDHIAAMYSNAFPGKVILTGADGEVGQVYATHLYHTWGAPVEELRAFFYRYSLQRELPIFIGEHNVPYPGSLYEIFKFSAGGSNPLSMENFVRYAGNDGYRWRAIYGRRVLHDVGPESEQGSRTDLDKDGRYYYGSDMYSKMINISLETMIPAWRHCGANGIGYFGYILGNHFSVAGASSGRWRELPMDLSDPDYHPEYLPGGAMLDAFMSFEKPFLVKPTLCGVPFQRVSSPFLVEFLAAGKDPYEQDHAWFGGDEISKKLLLQNDSESDQIVACQVTLRGEDNSIIEEQNWNMTLKQGTSKELVLTMRLPYVASRTESSIQAVVTTVSGMRSFDQIPIQIFPAVPKLQLNHTLYVCDPDGQILNYLDQLGVQYTSLETLDDLPEEGLLLIGRRGLSMNPTVPDFSALADNGLNILIMEQDNSASVELVEKRSRHGFINAPAHPVFYGLTDEDFSNWQGSVSLSTSFGDNNLAASWSHAGSRNMVATYVFVRPTHGNFLPLLCCGFDMFQTSLLEYRSQKASWLSSQLEIVPRLGKDPVATRVFHQMLGYLDNRRPISGKMLFYGGEKGMAMLERMKIEAQPVTDLNDESLADAHTLLISDPDFNALKNANFALARFVYRGGKILYLQNGEDFSSTWLPFPLVLEKKKSRLALHGVDKPDSFWRNGWGNNELYWHDEVEVPAFTEIPEQANAVNPGVIVDLPYGLGRYSFVSISPETFGDTYAAAKTSRFLCAVLTNAGFRIVNNSVVFVPKKGAVDCTVNLADFRNWEFALDPDNKGEGENVETGANGSLKWMTGLIADGAEVRVGISFESFLREEYDGYVWYRLNLEVPSELMNAEKAYLSFGAIDDLDDCYVNGVKVGSTGTDTPAYWLAKRNYEFSTTLFREGMNIIAIRVLDEKGEGGILRLPAQLSNRPLGGANRAWVSPYSKQGKRDYDYPQDAIRHY